MSEPSLADALRAASDDELLELLSARPDLAIPPPADSTVLATRAGTRASVVRVCDGLDSFTLTVLEALVAAGADAAPVPVTDVAGLLGPDVPGERLAGALRLVRRLALGWCSEAGIALVPAVREAVPAFPGGLGRSAPALAGADIPALLAGLSEPERRLLDTLAAGRPIGRTRDAATALPAPGARTPVQRLLARGLLLPRDTETVELPREVALALRGRYPMGRVAVDPPEPATVDADQATVDGHAAAEVMRLCRELEWLLRSWSQDPPGVLRSGGIGVRELRRIARECGGDERRATLLVELLVMADLAAVDEDADGAEWVPTTHADSWLAATTQRRWATVAACWLAMPRLPGLAALPGERDRAPAPLTGELNHPLAPARRRRTLAALSELEPGKALADVEDLVALLAWRGPRRGGRLRDEAVRWTMAEAAVLGVVAPGPPGSAALSGAGRALLGGADGDADIDAATAAMAAALPEPVEQVLVQADLTVVAPGPLEPELAAELALVADVESSGSATVYRVGEGSVRRALDAGRTAAELHELFRSRSATPVPQGLTYLVDDVARRHGQLRAGVAGSFLRADDELLLAEVLAGPVATRLQLRRIAPTVLVSPHPLVEVLDALRSAGFAPVAEGPDGSVLDLRPAGRRTAGRPRGSAAPSPARAVPDGKRLGAALQQLRAGDHAAAARRGRRVSLESGAGASSISATMAVLRQAAESGRQVWLDLVDSHGMARQRVLTPVRVGGGVLEGDDPDGLRLRFPLHLITSVALIED